MDILDSNSVSIRLLDNLYNTLFSIAVLNTHLVRMWRNLSDVCLLCVHHIIPNMNNDMRQNNIHAHTVLLLTRKRRKTDEDWFLTTFTDWVENNLGYTHSMQLSLRLAKSKYYISLVCQFPWMQDLRRKNRNSAQGDFEYRAAAKYKGLLFSFVLWKIGSDHGNQIWKDS